MKDKVIGILGGMGPEATIDLFSSIIAESNAKNDHEHLRIIIDNNPKMPSRQDAILNGGENPGPVMAETARNIEHAGADFIIIGANTAHYFYDYVKEAVDIPVLHIIDEAVLETIRTVDKVKKVGVLATAGAMKTKMYENSFNKFDIEVVEVPNEIQELVHNSIFSFKYDGLNNENEEMMIKAANYLIDNGAEALVMGCTEIPLVLGNKKLSVKIINPNDVITRISVKYAKNLIQVEKVEGRYLSII
ncbi:amino acid racemase [uncultured Ilyobacter sp.]|uniref:amino acid racemase n=1 Tax=uncultured Ilyobacter sp. TaxID=544433 RepID=UPI0029F533EC|nr:amino acid racemase [uncultured Ilyobacter sp.]